MAVYRLPQSEEPETTKTIERDEKPVPIERLLEAIGNDENIAELLSDKTLEMIGARVVEDFEDDKASREAWEDRSAEAIDLAMQVRQVKTTPWENCSNVKFPLLTIAAADGTIFLRRQK